MACPPEQVVRPESRSGWARPSARWLAEASRQPGPARVWRLALGLSPNSDAEGLPGADVTDVAGKAEFEVHALMKTKAARREASLGRMTGLTLHLCGMNWRTSVYSISIARGQDRLMNPDDWACCARLGSIRATQPYRTLSAKPLHKRQAPPRIFARLPLPPFVCKDSGARRPLPCSGRGRIDKSRFGRMRLSCFSSRPARPLRSSCWPRASVRFPRRRRHCAETAG